MRTPRGADSRRVVAVTVCIAFASGQALAQAPAPAAPAPAAAPAKASLADTLTGTAKADYEAGKLLYGDGDFAAALVKFQRAWELSKDVRLLWNMAACEKNLRHYARVLRLVQQYLAEGTSILGEQDKKDATELANAIKSFVSTLRVDVDQPGATLSIDDETVGTAPLAEPLLVDIGQRRLKVSKTGYKDFTTTIQAEGATEQKVDVKLEKDLHQGRIVISAGPKDTILLDGKPVGEGRWESVVTSGGHTLRVTAPGMRSYQTEITIQDNETRNLQVTLEADKSGGAVPTWVWITAGSLLVTGAAVGGYFALKPKDQTTDPVPGTIGIVQLPLIGRR